MQKTNIGYLTHTWNPIAMRCTPVSEGCKNCWHLRMVDRLKEITGHLDEKVAYSGGTPWLRNKELETPLRLRKPSRIGVQFMGDLFHEGVPDEFIRDVIDTIRKSPQHVFMILTKRPERMMNIYTKYAKYNPLIFPLQNIWLGVSVEGQKTADERIPLLLQTPAAVRFVSYEPALGPVGFGLYINGVKRHYANMVDWIIMGGETGPGARPMHPDWARSVQDQSKASGVPFWFKSWGEYCPLANTPIGKWPPHRPGKKSIPVDHTFEDGQVMFKAGTARTSGAVLDGRKWNEVPGGDR